MNLNETLANIRKRYGLTQEEFAVRLYVTRQAVSRWERGTAAPGLDTLKKIAEEFGVGADELLGTTAECQSCGMPLRCLDDLGTEADGGASADYCEYCYRGGKFTHERTLDEMIASNLRFLDAFNEGNGTSFSSEEARVVLKAHLATLKRWKNRES